MKTILNTRRRPVAFLAGAACALSLMAACGSSAAGDSSGGKVLVVAAENFWGSLAAQLGGDHAQVISIITNPNTDPHAYEPTPQDGRTIAQAQYAISDGAGYDPWAPKLIAANPSSSRRTLTVADLAGRHEGDNPHMWYDPTIVEQVIDRIASDLKALDPADAGYFDQQRATFTSVALKPYDDLRASIKGAYAGVPVGATESIFVDLAADLGLNLITPPEYMKAISEGNDPSAADKATFDAQITGKQIKVLVFNGQNSTPDIQALVDKAHVEGIPVVPITETLDPPGSTFQAWQSGQLAALQTALAQATSR
ncbi:MAG TPA: zinc ABC transporter substrate-binding protein [Candidatus Acidoferrales bacterium]|nr:zinc ABC transporter substrate-binding protein [Candidatus Acidoferrales bacterium]